MASGTWLTCAILIENADACTRTYVRVSDTSTVRTVGFLLTVRYSEVLVGFPTNLHYVRLYWKVGIPTAFTTLLIFHPPSNIVSGTAGVYGLGEWNTRISKHKFSKHDSRNQSRARLLLSLRFMIRRYPPTPFRSWRSAHPHPAPTHPAYSRAPQSPLASRAGQQE